MRHWPCLKHQLEHHGLVIIVLVYHDLCHMLWIIESCNPKQHIILSSHTSKNYYVYSKVLLSDAIKEY